MDQGGTWHRVGPRCRPHCARRGPSSPTKKVHSPLIFRPCLLLWRNLYYVQYFMGILPVNYLRKISFWETVCKTVRPMLSDRCPALSVCRSCSVLTVSDVGVLWRNDWMDQNETGHRGRPRPWPHCLRWGPSSPFSKGAQPPPPNFRPMSIVAKRVDTSGYQLVRRYI